MKDDAAWVWLVIVALIIGVPLAWHSKWRYAVQYKVPPSQVSIDSEPHGCDFLKAPLGSKDCHYSMVVSPSFDDNGRIATVDVSWEKIDE